MSTEASSMRRSAGVSFAAVVALLGSLGNLLLGLLMLVGLFLRTPAAEPRPALLTLLFFLLFAGWGGATSVGLFRLRRWARTSILIFAGLLTLAGLGMPITLATPMPAVPNADPALLAGVRTGTAVFCFFLGAIGVSWLVFFNLESVKQQFLEGQPASGVAERPASITLIAGLLIFGSLCFLGTLLLGSAVAFGQVITGWPATVWCLAIAGVGLYAGVGVLRLDERCRRLAIGYLAFNALNSAPFYLLPGRDERMAELAKRILPSFGLAANQSLPLQRPGIALLSLAALLGVQLYFLVTRRAAFGKHSAVGSA